MSKFVSKHAEQGSRTESLTANFIQRAREYGIRFSEEYISSLTEEPNDITSYEEFLGNLLDSDLRKKPFVNPFFSESVGSMVRGQLQGNVVLQIVSIVDISVPIRQAHRQRQSDLHRKNRLLVITLTDGHVKVTGIEHDHIPTLHVDIPPGDKVLFTGGEVCFGKLLLNGNNIKHIGGSVFHLRETWLANKIAQRTKLIDSSKTSVSKGVEVSGPPKFQLCLPDVGVKGNEKKMETQPNKLQNTKSANYEPNTVAAAPGKAKTKDKTARENSSKKGKIESVEVEKQPITGADGSRNFARHHKENATTTDKDKRFRNTPEHGNDGRPRRDTQGGRGGGRGGGRNSVRRDRPETMSANECEVGAGFDFPDLTATTHAKDASVKVAAAGVDTAPSGPVPRPASIPAQRRVLSGDASKLIASSLGMKSTTASEIAGKSSNRASAPETEATEQLSQLNIAKEVMLLSFACASLIKSRVFPGATY